MDRVEQLQGPLGAPPAVGPSSDVDEVDLAPVRTFWQLVRQRFLQHRLAVIALVVMIILVSFAIVIPTLTGDAFGKTDLKTLNLPPSLSAPLGTDGLGRNIFIRLTKALQTSLLVGFLAVAIIVGIGVTVGAIAGYVGGFIDNALMRLVDIVLSIPVFFLIVMLVAFFGGGDMRVIILAIGFIGWTLAARLVRAEFLHLRETDFVQAARALGASPVRIIVRHMLPSAIAPVIVAATLGIADSVVTESTLSYLGFGINPPNASLGNMLQDAQEYLFRQPILIYYPAVTLILLVLAASFLGDGLRDALDPRQRLEA
ncbi:MAG: ABC transporter permease [Chloroflexota bacterium]|nr:ABC transporter permease [Chloroflexota bacterium]